MDHWPENLSIRQELTAVACRAGLKLEAALDHFGVDVRGLRVLDSGLSTGGFADCLLQRGAAHVVGVDVGYGQVGHPEPPWVARTADCMCVVEQGCPSPWSMHLERACSRRQPHSSMAIVHGIVSSELWASRRSAPLHMEHVSSCTDVLASGYVAH